MFSYIKKFYAEKPVLLIMLIALTLRLIAAIFAKGYGMSDDHFCVIQTAQNWLWGIDLPSKINVSLRNIFYIGLHFELFKFFGICSIINPQTQMLIVRMIHALIAMATVWYGMKIVTHIYNEKAGHFAGLLLAFSWVLASLSVRNLIEMVCVPPLIAGIWYSIMPAKSNPEKIRLGLLSGILFAAAFIIRYQTASFIGVFFLLLLLNKDFVRSIAICISGILALILVLGIPEYLIYGKPFVSLIGYSVYNSDKNSIASYPCGPWYSYFGTLSWVLIPPASIAILAFFFKEWKKAAYIVLPTIAFLAFHSIYPNKQERFIIPALPFILMAAAGAWITLKEKMQPGFLRKSISIIWVIFWIGNSLFLAVSIFSYSKKSRVEIMSFFYDKPAEKSCIIVSDDLPPMPDYYAGRPMAIYNYTSAESDSAFVKTIDQQNKPLHIIYFSDESRKEMMPRTSKLFPNQILEKMITPSLMDYLFWAVNPSHNQNYTAYIYKISSK